VADGSVVSDNVWVVNMLEGVMNVGYYRLLGAGAAVLVGIHLPAAAIVLTVAWTWVGVWGWRQATLVAAVTTGQTQALRRADATSDLATTPQRAKEVRIFGLGDWIGARYASEWWTAMERIWTERARATSGATWAGVILLGAHVAALAVVAAGALDGSLGPAALIVVLQAILLTSNLGEGHFGHWEVEFGLRNIPELNRFERTIAESAEPMRGKGRAPVPRRAIRCEGVSFSYPGQGREVLDGCNLEIAAGTSMAIVGENGAGKTTLVQVLARLRDPTQGRITIDGVDLREFDPASWHQLVAAVSQQALRLTTSVADNIGAGRTSDLAILRRAADGAGVLELIESFPLGWDTPMARNLRGGVDLSGGQWQRLALARGLAALEAGAEILILDEPTAHLDVRAEADLYGGFLELARGKTTILVSHRFSTVRQADRIAVLAKGRIVEEGSHDELIDRGERYAQMFSLQAAHFADQLAPMPVEDSVP
jgi:ATP-binding cassette subfamily B protein